jgi:hypothetical protein
VSATYEGMFKEELDTAAQRYPDVAYQPLLIDATFALLLQNSGEALMAMNLASAALLTYVGSPSADRASRSIYESVFEAIYESKATPDLDGPMSTSDFTNEVIHKIKTKLEVWSALEATLQFAKILPPFQLAICIQLHTGKPRHFSIHQPINVMPTRAVGPKPH